MCGIVGFNWEDKKLIMKMASVLEHRGPDDCGFFEDKGISLGQRRLKIIDLSKKGNQPIFNEENDKCVICNGEIYNYKELREELEKKGHKFYSDSDSEVIIHAYEEYDVECFSKFNGMFGIAIWDSGKLILARDRIGIKPLFYYFKDGKFIFGSEVKAILQADVKRKLNKSALNQFLAYSYTIYGESLFEGVKELLPGNYLVFDKDIKKDWKLKISKYWDLKIDVGTESLDYYSNGLRKELKKSIKYRMISDVPVGAFLSGGLDSSIIVAMMQKNMNKPMNTFCIGYDDDSDEFPYAKIVAEHCGTNHHELHLDFNSIVKNLGKMMWHMEIPYARPSAFNLYFLSREAKKKITVIPVGEGADEVFGGYNRDLPSNWRGNSVLEKAESIIPGYFKKSNRGLYFKDELFESFEEKNTPESVFNDLLNHPKEELVNRALEFEIKTELPGLQLFRSDRMSMSSAIETRVPFLDHNVVEFGMKIPAKYKFFNNEKKYILQKACSDLLPKEIIKRPKFPFGMPQVKFYKEELKDVVKQVLLSDDLKKRDFFNIDSIKKIVKNADKDINEEQFRHLLFLTNLELWHKLFIDGDVKNPKLDINKLI